MNEVKVATTMNWNGTRCLRCGYVVKMGNRRTPESRRNWVAYCVERHDRTHWRTGAETKEMKESTATPATAMTADTITDEQVKSVRDELAKVRQNARTRSIRQDCSAALDGSRVCRESAAAAWNELHANPAAWNKLLANPSSSSTTSSALANLEREVMVAVREGLDPWKEVGGGGSRLVSQAIGRCERKGFLKESQGYTVRYLVTAAGRRALGDDADRTY